MATRKSGYKPTPKPTDIVVSSGRMKMTNRDLADAEKASGVYMSSLDRGSSGAPWAFIVALAWIAIRRDNPKIKYDDLMSEDVDPQRIMAIADLVEVPTMAAGAAN